MKQESALIVKAKSYLGSLCPSLSEVCTIAETQCEKRWIRKNKDTWDATCTIALLGK